jgi:small subunit ribosomal protein S15e
MADVDVDIEAIAALRKRRAFKKFTFRGVDLDKLMDLSQEELLSLLHARARRKCNRGLRRKHKALSNKLKAAKEC